jgi:hypothetical protein
MRSSRRDSQGGRCTNEGSHRWARTCRVGADRPTTGALLKALTSLRTADGFTVAVQRYGQTLNIRYNIDKPKDP